MDQKTNQTTSSEEDLPRWERLLNKYVSVWLWSILFGTTTGVLYSFLSFRYDRWGSLAVVLVVPALLSLALALASWFQLYRALTTFLLPHYVLHITESEELSAKLFAYCLRRAFLYFVLAAAFRAFASILEILLASAGGIG